MTAVRESLSIALESVTLEADAVVPAQLRGAVLFAHGSGSSRHRPRNQYVAYQLQIAGFATVLADPLTVEEERPGDRTATLRFDIGLLAARVAALTYWQVEDPPTAGQPVGLFGAGTGAAAALVAAAERPSCAQGVGS